MLCRFVNYADPFPGGCGSFAALSFRLAMPGAMAFPELDFPQGFDFVGNQGQFKVNFQE